jgi:hypothetical protein
MDAIGSLSLVARRHLAGALFGALVSVAACAPTTVQTEQDYRGAALPRPDRVVVYDFAVRADEVKLDEGVSARLISSYQSASRSEQERTAGRQVARAISKKIVEEVTRLGLYAELAQATIPPYRDNVVQIKGQILSIDEGNRTERNLIGLGAGRTEVEADAQILYLARGAATPRVLESMEAVAKSGRKPGMAETLGVGAAGGHLVGAALVGTGAAAGSEIYGANVEADGDRMGKQIAEHLAPLFARQGWIEPPQR